MLIPYLSITARDADEKIFGVDVPVRDTAAVSDALMTWAVDNDDLMPSGASIVRTIGLLLRYAIKAPDHTATVKFADAADVLIEMFTSMPDEEREGVE